MRLPTFLRFGACVVTAVGLGIGAVAPVDAARPKRPPTDQTPPSQPTNLRVTAVSQTSVTLAWNASTDNVGVMTYSLWGEGLSGVVSVPAPGTSGMWSSLRPGQTVTFRVTAFDARYNASTPSAGVTVTTLPDTVAPSTPSGLTVDQVVGSKVLLSWNSGTDDVRSGDARGPRERSPDGRRMVDRHTRHFPATRGKAPGSASWHRGTPSSSASGRATGRAIRRD